MKLTFVTPRVGDDIVGGAEHAVLMLAENCVKYGDVEVNILSTVAGDERTWSPRYEVGSDVVHGINVHRYVNEAINRIEFDNWARPLLDRPSAVSSELFDKWLIQQGPYSPDLLDAIENCNSDAIVFHPMLSSPTSHGVFRARCPVIIHPAFHDEPLSRMPGYGDVMRRADLIAFSTRYEQQLAQNIIGIELQRQSVLGFGVDSPSEPSAAKNQKILLELGLESSRYAIVIGRVDPAKGADMCFELFRNFASSIKGIDKLVFVGPMSPSSIVRESNNVTIAGAVDDETKWALLGHARCLISPSVTESFSLVVLEAMKMGVPVLVNGSCGPTREHVVRSSSGAYFCNSTQFISSLDICSIDSPLRTLMIQRAQKYVDEYYDWETLISRYIGSIEAAISFSTNS